MMVFDISKLNFTAPAQHTLVDCICLFSGCLYPESKSSS